MLGSRVFRSPAQRAGWRLAAAAALAIGLTTHQDAVACGCLSPPVPEAGDSDFAVNQQAEQILFEVEPGFVTAHVLIQYAGDPEQFAWIVPVPSEPELNITEAALFGALDRATTPQLDVVSTSLCPSPEYVCEQHPAPTCYFPPRDSGSDNDGNPTLSGGTSAASASGGANSINLGAPVTVVSRQQVGAYDTVVFDAVDAGLAVKWLQDEGFIVNETMTPYMQPYLDANMLFVASKLIPGADADEIRPLKMRYAADNPMIPLQLTAVAAEPHLTVTTYIAGSTEFEPVNHPVTSLDGSKLTRNSAGRINYPMLLSRAIDDAGGDAFVAEYRGAFPTASFTGDACCDSAEFDSCLFGGDGICSCPGADWEAADCSDSAELVDAAQELRRLTATHTHLTRLSTRLSPHEMTFDPAFEAALATDQGVLSLEATRYELQTCQQDIIDRDGYDRAAQAEACATTYCGTGGECAMTDNGPGCICEPGFVGRRFVDLDGVPSVTCVPDSGTVNLAASGISLPDACADANCGFGQCVDIGGFPACRCSEGAAAVEASGATRCERVVAAFGDPGGHGASERLKDVEICAPPPPEDCGQWGWLVPNTRKHIEGVRCASSLPDDPARFDPPPEPTCKEYFGPEARSTPYPNSDRHFRSNRRASGCACRSGAGLGASSGLGLTALLGLAIAWTRGSRRRRRRRRRQETILYSCILGTSTRRRSA